MITERTLRKWRKDALQSSNEAHDKSYPLTPEGLNIEVLLKLELNERILRLTQELLDQHLMKGLKAK